MKQPDDQTTESSPTTASDGLEASDEDASQRLAADPTELSPRSGDVAHLALGAGVDLAKGTVMVGPYRLLDVLGHGGMGTVYLAEQSDPLPRRVALKLIRWGGGSGEALRRFEIEREAMARLSHPAIAQVFDAGTSDDGQPYIVLEYIPGEPVTTYCDQRQLALRQRLELLVAVCDGVRHAHEKGVIHRDLKPSNILVTDTAAGPRPKIIDFGIAKALEPWSAAAAEATATRVRIGSPGYMSPEAVLEGGRAVDTRSDVYSLGVLLYELLAGIRPYDTPPLPLSGTTWHPDEEVPRPSQRLRALPLTEQRTIAHNRQLEHSALVRRLRGELDWIARRATEVSPAARYSTAAGLAADIERWLSGRPVEAKPPSFTYRARKALRRHAVVYAAALLILATIVGFGIRSNILYGRADTARVQAEELVGFMLDDLSARLEPEGRLDLLESIARKSLAYFESAAPRAHTPADRRPAMALRQIGRVLAARGDLEAAIDAYDKARELDQSRLDQQPLDLQPLDHGAQLDLAEDLKLLGRVRGQLGDNRRAESRLAQAETLLRDLAETSPDDPEVRFHLAALLAVDQANYHRLQSDVEAARSNLDEALEILQELLREHPNDTDVLHQLGEAHYSAGMLAMTSFQDPDSAIRAYQSGTEIFRALATSEPSLAKWRQRLAILEGQGLATAFQSLGRLTEARDANQKALALAEALALEEPNNGRWAHSLGWEVLRAGGIAEELGDAEGASQAYRRAAEIQAALVARTTGPNTAWLDGMAVAYEEHARLSVDASRLTAASESAERALDARRRISTQEQALPFYGVAAVAGALLAAEIRFRQGDLAGTRALLEETGPRIAHFLQREIQEPEVRSLLATTQSRFATLSQSLGTPRGLIVDQTRIRR